MCIHHILYVYGNVPTSHVSQSFYAPAATSHLFHILVISHENAICHPRLFNCKLIFSSAYSYIQISINVECNRFEIFFYISYLMAKIKIKNINQIRIENISLFCKKPPFELYIYYWKTCVNFLFAFQLATNLCIVELHLAI